jgi:hypothetical protein
MRRSRRNAEKDEARKWFDKGVAGTKEKDPINTELRRFWAEGAKLLGLPGPDGAGARSERAPALHKPQ